MAVRIRLKRLGRTHRPYYRVVATDGRRKRSGESCEVIGLYDPLQAEKPFQVDIDRIHGWLKRGAQYSDSVLSLVRFAGYEAYPAEILESKAKAKAKIKQKRQTRKKVAETPKGTYVAPKRRAVLKHQAKLKAARMEQLASEQAARAKAKAEAEAAAAPAEAAPDNAEG